MQADELKTFLWGTIAEPPADFQSGLDERNRYLNWWATQIQKHFGATDFRTSPMEFGDPTYIHSIVSRGTPVANYSSDVSEATLYFVGQDGDLTTLFAHSQVHAGPVDYLDDWIVQAPS